MWKRRLATLFPRTPGKATAWFGFIWGASSIWGNAQRLEGWMESVWSFLNSPNGGKVLVVTCFLWLLSAVFWADLKASLVKHGVLKPKGPSVKDRMGTIETEAIPSLKQTQVDMGRRIEGIEMHVEKRFKLIEGGWSESADQIRRLTNRTTGVTDVLTARMEGLMLFSTRLEVVIGQARDLLSDYLTIRSSYPESQVARLPFSDWRPHIGARIDDESVRAGLDWIHLAEYHYRFATEFLQSWSLDSEAHTHQVLFCAIAQVQQNPPLPQMEGALCVVFLRDHLKALCKLQKDQAARFTADLSAKATIS